MHRTVMNLDEQERKRNRNRLAQQKYRKKLKSHIEDLERRAAAADQLPKVNAAASPLDNDDISSFWHFTTPLNGHHHHNPQQQASASPPQTYNPSVINKSAESSLSSSTSNVDSFQKKPASKQQESYPDKDVMLMPLKLAGSMPDDSDFLKAFTISDDSSWANQKNISFREHINALSIQPESNVEGDPSLLRNLSSEQMTSLESRIDYILRSMQTVGFESPDSFLSCYYTSQFKDRSPVKLAQEASRGKGLPQILEELRAHASSWSTWESGAYRDTIVRSAAYIIAEEFDRLTKKKYSCEIDLQQNLYRTAQDPTAADGSPPIHQLHGIAAELKKTLCEEVPNIYALTQTFSAQDSPISQSTRVKLLLATIRIITASGREPLQEAADWAYTRAHSRFPTHSTDLSVEECDGSSVG